MSEDLSGYSPEFLKELQESYEIDQKPVSELSVIRETHNAGGDLHRAEDVRAAAEELISKLGGFVYRWELCGAVRRGHPMTKDGDIVLWLAYDVEPETMKNFQSKLVEVLADQSQEGNVKFIEDELKKDEPEDDKKKKRKRKVATSIKKLRPARKIFKFWYRGIKMEINIAKDEKQFEVLKFIRTGSADFHIAFLNMAQNQNMTVNFHHNDELNLDLYGLYGAISVWGEDRKTGKRKKRWIVNPARLVAWKENDIIEKVFGRYIEPADREPGRF